MVGASSPTNGLGVHSDVPILEFEPRQQVHCTLNFSESFRRKHPTLVKLSTGTVGNWVSHSETLAKSQSVEAETLAKSQSVQVHRIERLEDFRGFLIAQRRYAGKPKCGPVHCTRVLGQAS